MPTFEQLNSFYLSQTAVIIMVSIFVLAFIVLTLFFILTSRSGRGAILFPISLGLLSNAGMLYMVRTILQTEYFVDCCAWLPTTLLALSLLAGIFILIIQKK